MVSALLVSSSEKGREMLRELMRGVPEISPAVAASGAEARRLAAEVEYDLVVINAPFPTSWGTAFPARWRWIPPRASCCSYAPRPRTKSPKRSRTWA